MELSLSERIMLSTTRIVVLDSADHVLGTATGFFFMFSYNYITGSFIPALVTNRHVFEIGSKIAINITRKSESGEPEVGKFDRIILPFHAVIYHPDLEIDLAVIPIGETLRSLSLENKHYAISYLNKAYIPTLDEWNAFNAIEEVTMFGHPKGLADEVNNLPIFRKGITATHPRYDLNGKPWFMIDVACFKGSSGSPVFLLDEGMYTDVRINAVLPGPRFKFLGVMFAVPAIHETGKLIPVEKAITEILPDTFVYTNLGFVVKSNQLQIFDSILGDAD